MNLFESFDQYLHYPREQAYNLFLDVKNLKTFKVMLNVFILIYAITFTVNLATYETFNFALILNFVLLVILVFVRFFYSKYFKTENIRKSIFAFMIFVLLLSISIKILKLRIMKMALPNNKFSLGLP